MFSFLSLTSGCDWQINYSLENNTLYVLKPFRFESSLVKERITNIINYANKKDRLFINGKDGKEIIIRIKDLSKRFPIIPINWLEVINAQLSSDSQASEEDEIDIHKRSSKVRELRKIADAGR